MGGWAGCGGGGVCSCSICNGSAGSAGGKTGGGAHGSVSMLGLLMKALPSVKASIPPAGSAGPDCAGVVAKLLGSDGPGPHSMRLDKLLDGIIGKLLDGAWDCLCMYSMLGGCCIIWAKPAARACSIDWGCMGKPADACMPAELLMDAPFCS